MRVPQKPNTLKGWSEAHLRAHVDEVLGTEGSRFEWACALCCSAYELGMIPDQFVETMFR